MTDTPMTDIDYRHYEDRAHVLRAAALRDLVQAAGEVLAAVTHRVGAIAHPRAA